MISSYLTLSSKSLLDLLTAYSVLIDSIAYDRLLNYYLVGALGLTF